MVIREDCPWCGSRHHKKNGHVHNGKQNHQCKVCGRQFVRECEQRRVSAEHRALIERLLNERLSLCGICRAVGVGMKWLMGFLVECYQAAPVHLNVQSPQRCDSLLVPSLEAEADEVWSLVGKKTNPQWLRLALEARSRNSARRLWNKLPAVYREHATFHTDAYAPYGRVIPKARAPANHQGGPQDQSRGALQRHLTAATLAAGALGVVVFEKLDPSPRRDLLFHLRLQPDSNGTLSGPIDFALSITWNTLPMADLIQFRSLTPHLLTAQTLGSGHFSPLFVPDQINAMLSTFVELYSPASKDGRLANPPGSCSGPRT